MPHNRSIPITVTNRRVELSIDTVTKRYVKLSIDTYLLFDQ